MKKEYPKEFIRPTSHEQVVFKDGMIVTADDLQAASNYSLGVFQTLIRAFFGCGIVCGLKVEIPKSNVDVAPAAAAATNNNGWCVQIQPGVALDCQGNPLELCKVEKIDLTPDPCSLHTPKCVCIAIRRYIEEEPQAKSGCSGNESVQSSDCTRKREQLMIKVFEAEHLPENICKLPELTPAQQAAQSEFDLTTLCECIKACPEHNCCGEGWVLLACIKLGQCGIECIDNRRRKYVKPIDCLCPAEEKECLYEQADVDEMKNTSNQTHDNFKASTEPAAEKPKSGSRNNTKAIKK